MKKILLIVIGAIVLIGAAGITTYFMLAKKAPSQDELEASSEAEKDAKKSQGPPIYHTLSPKFVVNFLKPSRARYLEVSLEVMSREDKAIDAVKQHMPAIRDRLVLLFSSQESQAIASREGKEALRSDVLKEIQQVLQEQINEPGVEQVYFTSFVMQ